MATDQKIGLTVPEAQMAGAEHFGDHHEGEPAHEALEAARGAAREAGADAVPQSDEHAAELSQDAHLDLGDVLEETTTPEVPSGSVDADPQSTKMHQQAFEAFLGGKVPADELYRQMFPDSSSEG